MGYSESLSTIEERRDLLGPLLDNEPARWTCARGEERLTAYQIRECFNIVRSNPQAYPKLFLAAQRMSIRRAGPGEVIAVVRRDPSLPAVVVSHAVLEDTIPVEEVGRLQIVERWLKADASSVRFPHVTLTHDDLRSLHAWSVEQNILLFWSHPSLTIQEYDEELAPHAFDPEEDL